MDLSPVLRLDPAALLFVINAAAGALDVDAKRGVVIEAALAARGRQPLNAAKSSSPPAGTWMVSTNLR